jgi:16S rRNA A1518/A1519 N6-dimethyltransferase RsmA/KsgA/DIM1 with predicted DNA glycosylase/AP lyase activity
MTVFAHHYSEPSYVFQVDKRYYFPEPQVDGALVVFRLLPPDQREHVEDEREFMSFVRQSFGSKRKMLTNSLQPQWMRDDVSAALQQLGRAESVRCLAWPLLCRAIANVPQCMCVCAGAGCRMTINSMVFFHLKIHEES